LRLGGASQVPMGAPVPAPFAPMRRSAELGAPRDGFAERVTSGAQEVRIRNLEAALDAMRRQHAEEVTQLQDQLMAIRTEAINMRRQLADHEATSMAHASEIAARDKVIADRDSEVASLSKQLEVRRLDAERHLKQLNELADQVRKSNQEVLDVHEEKERTLGPLNAKIRQLGRDIDVKDKQMGMLHQDLEVANQRIVQLDSELAAARDHGERLQLRLDESIRELRAELRAQAEGYERRDRLLRARCRLLQTWCFRAWWSLESGMDPLQILEAAPEGLPVPEEAEPTSPPGSDGLLSPPVSPPTSPTAAHSLAGDLLPRRRMPMPPDWRSVIRFQATLFHWLAAESMRAKKLEIRDQVPKLLAGTQRALDESVAQLRQRDSMVHGRQDTERTAWLRELERLEGRLTRLGLQGKAGEKILEDLVALRTRTAEAAEGHADGVAKGPRPMQPLEAYLAAVKAGREPKPGSAEVPASPAETPMASNWAHTALDES